ncbi:MAG: hypothetical protein CENE_02742 [Candidatus Celerinatantimonas neptuna]|nr:MAG: hypothetical protein CENE_02742 [Candidatus Celerinatantimonas neptuna]
MITSILLICAVLSAAPAMHSCESPKGQHPLGQIMFTKWWFDIYRASLYQPLGTKSAQLGQPGTRLQITYLRSISHESLVKQTQKEWQYLKLESSLPLSHWSALLNQIWPDVSKGDCIEFRVLQNKSGAFYLGTQKIGQIEDPRFAPAFLSIWLSPGNHYPKLRRKLLGISKGK